MPLGRKHLRRSRDAPTGGIGHTQRAASRLGGKPSEVNELDALRYSKGSAHFLDKPVSHYLRFQLQSDPLLSRRNRVKSPYVAATIHAALNVRPTVKKAEAFP